MIDLSAYPAIETATLLKWVIPNLPATTVSDYNTDIVFDGDTYQNIGNLMSISNTKSEIKASPSQISVVLSGLPTGSVTEVLNEEVKGSSILITRAYFDPTTKLQLGGVPPLTVFQGIVTNYSVEDAIDMSQQVAVTTITLACNSAVEILSKKVNGRRTNPEDFPGEDSMNRVHALTNSNIQFGAPTGTIRV